ncbi:hypothetical protein MHU86_21923 [Fragilaria crotonensis]|nr:hypothetical protein MHU86_21923 [Fragilaria crotonensis]
MDLKKAVQRNAADDATCTPGIPACMPFVHAKSMTIEKPRGKDAAVQDEEHRSRLDARQKFLDGVVIIENVIVPFCHACTDSLEVHHSLCPKHPLFAKSGALEKLERIRSGVKIGCAYCTTQYETGASGKDNVQHSIQCKRMEKERRRMANNDSAKPGEIAERHFCEDGETCITMNALDDRTPSAVAKTNLKRRAKPSVVTPGVVDFAKDSPKMRLDGCITLPDRRGSLAKIHGEIEHHDFGGACLINSIDQNSPASVATYVGGSCRSPLCMHDMILTVNGDDVGGMTEAGFELAVETSGVQVILGVSRYRFPTLVDRLNADLENETWVALDRTLDDKRNLAGQNLIWREMA